MLKITDTIDFFRKRRKNEKTNCINLFNELGTCWL